MAETGQTRITSFGGNPTTYNNNSARILKGRNVTILRPEGGIEHRMYDDGTMTRVDNRTGEFIPVPEEYDAYWRNAFKQAQTNARPNLLQRGVHWVGRGIEKAGNWLQRFEDGGTTLQVASPEQDVMNTIDAAIGEIQTKRPGQAVQKLAAMMQDPNYSMIIDMIKQEYPQIEGILNTVEQMVGAYKCGGKAKKKVKKGAKGCVPCKKLMKVGGKLINVWSDCEGNIISKHQAGGWLIPKGLVGLTAQFVQEPYRKAKAATDTGSANDVHYYLNDDNKIYMQTYGDRGWGAGLEADMNNFKNWVTTANASGQILGKNFFVNGFNFDYSTNMGTMSKNDAQAAGIDSDQFKTSLGTRGKYEASYNPLFGESKPSEVDITQGYINSLGGMNAAVKHERQQRRKDRREQRAEHRGYNSSARLSTKDLDASNDFNVLTTDEKLANLNNIDTNYANLASHMAAAMKAKWANYNVGTPASATTSSSTANSRRDVLKQGGWLTKFLDGGVAKFETPWKKLEKAGKKVANWLGLTETRTEETRSPELTEEYISYDPHTNNISYLSPETYRRVITSYKVPGLSNDTAHYILPGTYAVETPGGIIGKTTYYPTVDGYTQLSWEPIKVETGSDDVYYPASEAEKFKHMWYSLPRFRGRGSSLGPGGERVKIHDHHNDGVSNYSKERSYSKQ